MTGRLRYAECYDSALGSTKLLCGECVSGSEDVIQWVVFNGKRIFLRDCRERDARDNAELHSNPENEKNRRDIQG